MKAKKGIVAFMDPVSNPYTPGAGAPPPALTGRDSQLERFRVLARRVIVGRPEKSMLITGLRGVGKTVLLNTFAGIAEEIGFVSGTKEVTEGEEFAAAVARMVRRSLLKISPPDRLRARVRKALSILKAFSVKLPEGIEIGIDVEAAFGTADSGNLQEDLADLFVALGEAAVEGGTGVMFLFDEIQYLRQRELAALITAEHRIAQKALPLTVVGAGLPPLPALAGEAKSYAERLFDIISIGSLSREDSIEALVRPAQELGVEFEAKAAEQIYELSEGYPYFLQVYGKHVWNVAPSSPIGDGDVDRAKPTAVADLDENFFGIRVARVTASERRYLRAMAELGGGPYRSGDIADKLGRPVTSVGPLRAQLIHKGFIYSPAHGLNDFTVPQFDDFMRRNYPFPL